jgi:hypothetical protein
MLKKTILIKSHGVPASIHRVAQVNVNADLETGTKTSSIVVKSFFNEEAISTNLQPLATVTIYVQDAPADGQALKDFAEAALTAAQPENAGMFGAERYAFAGAEVIADEAV